MLHDITNLDPDLILEKVKKVKILRTKCYVKSILRACAVTHACYKPSLLTTNVSKDKHSGIKVRKVTIE